MRTPLCLAALKPGAGNADGNRVAVMLWIPLIIIAIGLYTFSPQITGLITREAAYSEPANLVVAANGSYQWSPENAGELLSLRIDGSLTNNGTAKVYLESNGMRKLVFDSSRLQESLREEQENATPTTLSQITALVVGRDNTAPVWEGETQFTVGKKTAISLNRHFTDVDKDKLSYTAAAPLNVEVGIEGNELLITPDEGFSGERTLFVTADDGQESTTQAITLIVESSKAKPPLPEEAPGENETSPDNTTETPEQEQENDSAPPSNETGPIGNITGPAEENATEGTPVNETAPAEEAPEEAGKAISLALSYGDSPLYDINNDGIEALNGVVDFTVEKTSFSWGADGLKLCTRWEITSEDEGTSEQVCYGSTGCCAFVGLESSADGWNTTYYSTYGRKGETANNVVAAQVISYDVNLSLENLKSDIAYSSWENLTAKYTAGYSEFSSACLDTCLLSGLNKTSYNLIFEIEGEIILRVDNLIYTVRQDVANAAPVAVKDFPNITIIKNRNLTINLSGHFSDEDGDSLSYSAFDADNLSVEFDGETATIVPDKGFAGTRYTYVLASDSSGTASSNVFRIIANDTEQLTPRIEAGQTVTWVKRIPVNAETGEISVGLPPGTLNFSVAAVSNESVQEISDEGVGVLDEGNEKTKREFENDQQIKEVDRAISLLSEAARKGATLVVLAGENITSSRIDGRKQEFEDEKEGLELESKEATSPITGNATGSSSLDGYAISDISSPLPEESVRGNATVTITGIPSEAKEVEVVYTTQAPILIETPQWNGKEIFVSSEASYTNVFVGTDIPNTLRGSVHLFWVQDGTRTEFSAVDMADRDVDGLVDRLEWYAPHLPNQTFEVTLTIHNNQTIDLSAGGGFIVQDSAGDRIMVIDSLGNANIKGLLTQGAEPTADTDDFIIQNSTGWLNAVLTNPQGNFLLKGALQQSQSSPLSPTPNSFIIQNKTGATVAYINATGGMYLTGTLMESVVFT